MTSVSSSGTKCPDDQILSSGSAPSKSSIPVMHPLSSSSNGDSSLKSPLDISLHNALPISNVTPTMSTLSQTTAVIASTPPLAPIVVASSPSVLRAPPPPTVPTAPKLSSPFSLATIQTPSPPSISQPQQQHKYPLPSQHVSSHIPSRVVTISPTLPLVTRPNGLHVPTKPPQIASSTAPSTIPSAIGTAPPALHTSHQQFFPIGQMSRSSSSASHHLSAVSIPLGQQHSTSALASAPIATSIPLPNRSSTPSSLSRGLAPIPALGSSASKLSFYTQPQPPQQQPLRQQQHPLSRTSSHVSSHFQQLQQQQQQPTSSTFPHKITPHRSTCASSPSSSPIYSMIEPSCHKPSKSIRFAEHQNEVRLFVSPHSGERNPNNIELIISEQRQPHRLPRSFPEFYLPLPSAASAPPQSNPALTAIQFHAASVGTPLPSVTSFDLFSNQTDDDQVVSVMAAGASSPSASSQNHINNTCSDTLSTSSSSLSMMYPPPQQSTLGMSTSSDHSDDEIGRGDVLFSHREVNRYRFHLPRFPSRKYPQESILDTPSSKRSQRRLIHQQDLAAQTPQHQRHLLLPLSSRAMAVTPMLLSSSASSSPASSPKIAQSPTAASGSLSGPLSPMTALDVSICAEPLPVGLLDDSSFRCPTDDDTTPTQSTIQPRKMTFLELSPPNKRPKSAQQDQDSSPIICLDRDVDERELQQELDNKPTTTSTLCSTVAHDNAIASTGAVTATDTLGTVHPPSFFFPESIPAHFSTPNTSSVSSLASLTTSSSSSSDSDDSADDGHDIRRDHRHPHHNNLVSHGADELTDNTALGELFSSSSSSSLPPRSSLTNMRLQRHRHRSAVSSTCVDTSNHTSRISVQSSQRNGNSSDDDHQCFFVHYPQFNRLYLPQTNDDDQDWFSYHIVLRNTQQNAVFIPYYNDPSYHSASHLPQLPKEDEYSGDESDATLFEPFFGSAPQQSPSTINTPASSSGPSFYSISHHLPLPPPRSLTSMEPATAGALPPAHTPHAGFNPPTTIATSTSTISSSFSALPKLSVGSTTGVKPSMAINLPQHTVTTPTHSSHHISSLLSSMPSSSSSSSSSSSTSSALPSLTGNQAQSSSLLFSTTPSTAPRIPFGGHPHPSTTLRTIANIATPSTTTTTTTKPTIAVPTNTNALTSGTSIVNKNSSLISTPLTGTAVPAPLSTNLTTTTIPSGSRWGGLVPVFTPEAPSAALFGAKKIDAARSTNDAAATKPHIHTNTAISKPF